MDFKRRPSSIVYRLSSVVHQTRHRPAWVALLITQWGDGARAGKLRLIFWKRCLSHRLTVESPVIGLFTRARPSVVGWRENSLPFTCFSEASLGNATLTVKMQVDRNRNIHPGNFRDSLNPKPGPQNPATQPNRNIIPRPLWPGHPAQVCAGHPSSDFNSMLSHAHGQDALATPHG